MFFGRGKTAGKSEIAVKQQEQIKVAVLGTHTLSDEMRTCAPIHTNTTHVPSLSNNSRRSEPSQSKRTTLIQTSDFMARIDHVRSRAENRGKTDGNVKHSVKTDGKCEKRGKTRGIHV